MNNVNGVNTNNEVTTLTPAEMSQQDFIAAVYLERGEMLDSEVRRIIGEMDASNQHVETVNTMLGKANIAEYGMSNYEATTWNAITSADNTSVVLDNGYNLIFGSDGDGGTTFTIMDADGNQLLYQNQTLIPVPDGTTVDALEVGIPVMSDMTFILDDGTEISLNVAAADTVFDQQNLSGGLASISSIFISRDNQGMTIAGVDTGSITITGPTIETPTAPEATEPVLETETYTATVDIPAESINKRIFYPESVDSSIYNNGGVSSFKSAFLAEWNTKIVNMTDEEKEAFKTELISIGMSSQMVVNSRFTRLVFETQGADDWTINSHSYMTAGESLYQFMGRAFDATNVAMSARLEDDSNVGASIYLAALTVNTTIPAYSYDVTRTRLKDPDQLLAIPRPINTHTVDTDNNDGHILIESGGLHSWEYGGKNISHLKETDPNDPSAELTGYFARKLIFEQNVTNEFSDNILFLSEKEKNLLTNILKIPFVDASGTGSLTPNEWGDLKQKLINARDNLNGNNQIQTVQLQRAMTTYNQNYEAMSNAQQRIYNLLKDIISNVK